MPFEIERYKWSAKRLLLEDIDWDEVPRHHLPSGAIESMLYMMDIETHTVIFLSELLVSKACMDPVITSFLSIWGYEEMYHGEAFVKFRAPMASRSRMTGRRRCASRKASTVPRR